MSPETIEHRGAAAPDTPDNSALFVMMQDPIYNRIRIPRPTLTAASAFVCLAVAGLWLSTLAEIALGISGMAVLNAIYYLPFLGLPLWLYARRRPGLSEGMRLNPLPGLSVMTLAGLALLSVYVASGLAAAWGAGLNALGLTSPGASPMPQTKGELALSILTMAAFPAVFEELLFRGFVLSAWESRGTALAIGVSAALFALLHGNLYGLPAYVLVGLVAGFVTWALDSVYAGITYHTLYNAACLVIPFLMARDGQAADPDAALTGVRLAAALVQTTLLEGLMAAVIYVMWNRAKASGALAIPRIHRPLAYGERVTLALAVLLMAATTAIVQILAAMQRPA